MTGRLGFEPFEAHRPRLTGSAAQASLRERPPADAPGEPLPWYKGGLGETGAELPIPWDGSLAITGCGSPDCNGACGLEPASEPTAHAAGDRMAGGDRICGQCSGPLWPGEKTCRTPGCRAPAGLAGLTRSGVEIH